METYIENQQLIIQGWYMLILMCLCYMFLGTIIVILIVKVIEKLTRIFAENR